MRIAHAGGLQVTGTLAAPRGAHAQAQATTGIVGGVVRDSSGAAVPGATVTLRNLETNFTRTRRSSELGIYVATLLPLGSYEGSVRALGFLPARRTGFRYVWER